MDLERVDKILSGMEALLGCLRTELAPEELAPEGPLCPHCGEKDGEKLQDTGALGEQRMTCLTCGKSWRP